jgi:hypothetical protein
MHVTGNDDTTQQPATTSRVASARSGAVVNTPVAVVGCRPHSDQSLVEHELVALHHQLVRTGDEGDVVHRVELRDTSTTRAVSSDE